MGQLLHTRRSRQAATTAGSCVSNVNNAASCRSGPHGSVQLRVLLLLLVVLGLGSCRVAAQQQAEVQPKVLYGHLQVVVVHDKEDEQAARYSPRKLGINSSDAAAAPAAVASAAVPGTDQGQHSLHYRLMTKTGRSWTLLFPKQPKHVPRSDAFVMVRLANMAACNTMLTVPAGAAAADSDAGAGAGAADNLAFAGSSSVCVSSMLVQEAAPRDVFVPAQPRGPYSFKALVMQLQVCGLGPATTPDRLEGVLFDGLPNSQAQTLQGAFLACSYGNADFSKASGVQVLTVTVPIPCSGTTPWGQQYDSKTCPYVEWSDMANQYVKDLGIQWDSFKHKVYVVPPGDLCSWGGMGYVGCTSDCRAWISGDLWQYPTTWLHELGHNLYMNHAGSYQDVGGATEFVNYKDDSGAMGHCCSMRCFNAPHSYQAGWSKPLDVLHKDNLAAGVWRSYVLPPRQGDGSSATNMLRVLGDWAGPSSAYNMFIEYRAGQGYDSGLLGTVKDKVTLYSTPLGDAMPFTTLEAAVGPNQMLRESRMGSGLTVWVGSKAAGGVRVHLCRPSGAVEGDCGDGLDADCDGYVDGEDPDCQHPASSTGQARRRALLQDQPGPGPSWGARVAAAGGPFDSLDSKLVFL